jgi:hypothetical protein
MQIYEFGFFFEVERIGSDVGDKFPLDKMFKTEKLRPSAFHWGFGFLSDFYHSDVFI